MPLTRKEIDALADEVLTFIEQREAEQVAYGVYDVTLSGADVIAGFQPIDGSPLAIPDREGAIGAALRRLTDEVQIIRLNGAAEPNGWVFRSRVAEIVRLLTKLRQRRVRTPSEKSGHRISKGKRLVEDVKFHVAARRVPRRDIPARACLTPLLTNAGEHRVAAEILLEVIEGALPKLRSMSGFQRRALEAILQAIELEPARGTERGVVVTASTGAGKTYAFFLPVLAKIIIDRCLRGRVSVKAICIYPRVALSENQLTDFVEVLFYLNQVLERRGLPLVTIGIESGAAVYRGSELQNPTPARRTRLAAIRGWSYNEEHGGYLAPFAYCVGVEGQECSEIRQQLMVTPAQPQLLRCPICGTTYPFIQFVRDAMRAHPPDILIATTESLNRRLLSSTYQYLFGTAQFAAPSIVMLDEIHLQTSTAGTQVALLLRRLLARIRLGKQERRDPANLVFVGLSATISQPVQFLAELTGLPVPRISEVRPNDDEMQVIGAERFIFVRAEDSEDTAVISTLIQTAMCVLHAMPQPPSGGALKTYRSFGFVQSLDLVGRWLYQMQDAEKTTREGTRRRTEHRAQRIPVEQWPIRDVPLYVYRYPPFNHRLFPAYFGPGTSCDCDCEHRGPSPACRFFQAGECWWALSQGGGALQRPLNIKRKSGADRDKPIEQDDDLIITTSALEVGYDDEALMCVLQYTAPANVASFVQRKGRGGRKVGTRPIVVTVLSPYKSTDLFLFRNHHLLTDPVFRKLPLNAQNLYLQRIHGFYALFDWLAYRASRDGSTLDFDRLSLPDFAYLLRQAADADVLLAFKDYLRRTFDMSAEALQRVLTEESEGLLVQMLADSLVKQAHAQFAREQRAQIEPRELLRSLLPENLFSDINLPEVRVYYRPESRSAEQRPSSESISLALSETIPGNVTFRGGQGATWVPPLGRQVDGERSLVAIASYYKELEELRGQPDTANLPRRALRMVGIDPLRVHELTVYRPGAIAPVQFSRDHNSAYWYAQPETGELRMHRDYNEAGQDVQRLAHSTSAYLIGATDISSRRRTPTPDYTFDQTHSSIALDPVGRHLVGQIVLHSDEPANLNMLKVQRIILGSQYTLKFHESREEEIRQAVGFCLDENSATQCALGYQMNTEGLMLELSPGACDRFEPSLDAQARLRANTTLHRFITELTVTQGKNYFAAENLAAVLLTMADRWCNEQGGAIDGLRQWFSISSGEFNRRLVETVGDIYQRRCRIDPDRRTELTRP